MDTSSPIVGGQDQLVNFWHITQFPMVEIFQPQSPFSLVPSKIALKLRIIL